MQTNDTTCYGLYQYAPFPPLRGLFCEMQDLYVVEATP